MFGREEKVSAIRLTAVQYLILVIFLILAYGLWRLQVMQSDEYAQLAEKNRIRNVPILAPRGKILDREGRTIVDNYPSFSALLLRDSTRDLNADADADRAGAAPGSERSARTHPPVHLDAAVPAHLSERRHHAGRTGLHRGAQERTARTRHHHGAPPPVSAQRVHGAPDRLRRRSDRGHAQPAAVRALQPGRRGGRVGRGEAVQPGADGEERFAPRAGE